MLNILRSRSPSSHLRRGWEAVSLCLLGSIFNTLRSLGHGRIGRELVPRIVYTFVPFQEYQHTQVPEPEGPPPHRGGAWAVGAQCNLDLLVLAIYSMAAEGSSQEAASSSHQVGEPLGLICLVVERCDMQGYPMVAWQSNWQASPKWWCMRQCTLVHM